MKLPLPWGSPKGRGHCVLSRPSPRLLCSVGTVPYRFRRKGSSPWWPMWVPGHHLEAPRGTAPQLRDPAQPHSSGRPALNIILRAPCRQGRHTLPQAWGLCVCSFWVILLTSQKRRQVLWSISRKTQYNACEVRVRPADGPALRHWMQCTRRSILLKANKKIHLGDFPPCLFISSRVLPLEFPTPRANQHTLSNLTE